MQLYIAPKQTKAFSGSFLVGVGYTRGEFRLLSLQRTGNSIEFRFSNAKGQEVVFSNTLQAQKGKGVLRCMCDGVGTAVPEALVLFARTDTTIVIT